MSMPEADISKLTVPFPPQCTNPPPSGSGGGSSNSGVSGEGATREFYTRRKWKSSAPLRLGTLEFRLGGEGERWGLSWCSVFNPGPAPFLPLREAAAHSRAAVAVAATVTTTAAAAVATTVATVVAAVATAAAATATMVAAATTMVTVEVTAAESPLG